MLDGISGVTRAEHALLRYRHVHHHHYESNSYLAP